MVYIRFTTLLYLVRKRCRTGGSCWGLVERFTLGLSPWSPWTKRLDMPWHRRLPEGDAKMAPERFSSKSFWPQKLDWRAGLCFLGPQESWGRTTLWHGVHRPREDGTICILLGICSQYACRKRSIYLYIYITAISKYIGIVVGTHSTVHTSCVYQYKHPMCGWRCQTACQCIYVRRYGRYICHC